MSNRLPIELVHLICVFTGKFIIENGKLRSIVCLPDYENIHQHLILFSKLRYEASVMSSPRFFRFQFNYMYLRIPMTKEERNREELLLYSYANHKRHPLLFMREGGLEEVMVPLQKGIICDDCGSKLPSVTLASKTPWRLRHFRNPIFERWVFTHIENGRCYHCFKLIRDSEIKKNEPIKQSHIVPIQKNVRWNLKGMGRHLKSRAPFR